MMMSRGSSRRVEFPTVLSGFAVDVTKKQCSFGVMSLLPKPCSTFPEESGRSMATIPPSMPFSVLGFDFQ